MIDGIVRTDYLKSVLEVGGLQKRVEYLQTIIERHNIDFEAIAVRGNSGIICGAPLSILLNKPLILVRKDLSSTHSSYKVEGYTGVKKYIIIDDLISSGETVEAIIADIRNYLHAEAKCVAVLCYGYASECMGDMLSYKIQAPIYFIDASELCWRTVICAPNRQNNAGVISVQYDASNKSMTERIFAEWI